MSRKLRMGMVGGGEGAFIGAVHRIAANMDGHIELVCGAFSSDPDRSRRSGEALYLPEDRCYADYRQMMERESQLPAERRMDFVAIVTPNHLHYPIAAEAIKHGFHVMSEKPATLDVDEVLKLRSLLAESGLLFGLAHTYTGYPLVKQAREMIREGRMGTLRKILVEYPQGWLANKEEQQQSKQAAWRLDPAQAGGSCCTGDIGVHAFNLAEYISGLQVEQLCADLHSFVPGRVLDDDAAVILRFKGGARGVLVASQIATGEENALKIRIYGDLAGLEWSQQDPNTLWLKSNDKPLQAFRASGPGLGKPALEHGRTPPGHPEGYLEAFANLYRNFARQLQARLEGEHTDADPVLDVPGIEEGVRGMMFIDCVLAAARSDRKWHKFPEYKKQLFWGIK